MHSPSNDLDAARRHRQLEADDVAPWPATEDTNQPPRRRGPSRRPSRAFWAAMAAVLGLAAAYVAYERVDTRANADHVTHYESFSDEAVALGMSDDQPGFVLFSRLPATAVSVEAKVQSNWLTGQHTILHLATPAETTRFRLRAPHVVLIDADGTIHTVEVDWTREDFAALAHAADCETPCQSHKHRCGRPLADMAELIQRWPDRAVPGQVRKFIGASQ